MKDTVGKTLKKAKAYFTKEYGNHNKHAVIQAKQDGYGSLANQPSKTPSEYPFDKAKVEYTAAE